MCSMERRPDFKSEVGAAEERLETVISHYEYGIIYPKNLYLNIRNGI